MRTPRPGKSSWDLPAAGVSPGPPPRPAARRRRGARPGSARRGGPGGRPLAARPRAGPVPRLAVSHRPQRDHQFSHAAQAPAARQRQQRRACNCSTNNATRPSEVSALFDLEYRREVFRWAAARVRSHGDRTDLAGVLADQRRGPAGGRSRAVAGHERGQRLRRPQPRDGEVARRSEWIRRSHPMSCRTAAMPESEAMTDSSQSMRTTAARAAALRR